MKSFKKPPKKTKKQLLETQAIKLWKAACLKKWGSFCEVCGEPADTFHHFIPKSRNGLLKYDVMNGIPICRRCHYKIHFSPSPTEVYRIIATIRRKRGKKWCNYIDKAEKIHKSSFKTVAWLEEQIKKLKKLT